MFCPKCGKINPDSEQTCSGCGAELHEETAVAVQKKKGNGLKIVLAVVVLLVVAAVIALLLSGCGTGEIPKEHMTF